MRVLRIITSIDVSAYPDLTNQQICETLASENGAEIAAAYSILPGYINTTFSVSDEVIVEAIHKED